jgi:hypothetical protein
MSGSAPKRRSVPSTWISFGSRSPPRARLGACPSGLRAFGGADQAVRDARGDEDEREALIDPRATSAAGSAMVLVLTGAVVVELFRGKSRGPYV